MHGLLPIIRRVRRPLLPVDEPAPLPWRDELRESPTSPSAPVAVSVPSEPVAPSPVIKKKTHGTAAKTPDP